VVHDVSEESIAIFFQALQSLKMKHSIETSESSFNDIATHPTKSQCSTTLLRRSQILHAHQC